jgi:hypothetical protein
LATAVAAGSATITVTTQDGNKTATSAITVTSPPAANNLVKNHSFENDLTDWTVTGGTGVIDGSNAQSGSKALKVGPTNWSWVQQTLSGWTPGSTYTFSAWGKAAASGNAVRVAVKTSAGELREFDFTSTSYSQQTATVTIPAGATWAQVYVTNRTSGTGFADNISLSSSASVNSLENTKITEFEKHKASTTAERLQVYPNPSKGRMSVVYEAPSEQPVKLLLINSQGQILKQLERNAAKGQNTFEIDVPGIETGLYMLQLFDASSKKALSIKILAE